MATATAPAASAPHRFTVADSFRTPEVGVRAEDDRGDRGDRGDRVELLSGQVVDRRPVGPPTAAAPGPRAR